ncbi:spore photoproduct lyase family protein [Parvularcula maris]|uniref:Radical SAM protein n=1 Tax=Parvularcula maris TaxID=2965077 RepID=A0A9X2L6G7_9PROT|nr:hypothetical protein [Parvularcula maris]MCQ8183836.1 hypothetical protein [Parvularcula maris]
MVQAPAAPHLAPSRQDAPRLSPVKLFEERPNGKQRLWVPKRILVTRSAAGSEIAKHAAERGAALGAEIIHLKGDQVRGLRGETEVETYRRAKSTLAIVNAPPSALKLQPIPPSADFRLDLAVGCPAHCQYCYLAGSLQGPPVTRAYANLDEILSVLPSYLGQGRITSRSDARSHEGTTFEASCYTDPLGIEHLTGSLSRTIEHFASWNREGAEAGLRFTTKYAEVEPLLALDHGGRTRVRFSVNAEAITRRFEGGTAPLQDRLHAMGRLARAGYPVGLTIAPIMPIQDWPEAYGDLFRKAAAELPQDADVTAELITHRFTPGSREVLMGWYPATKLEMDPAVRAQKRNKFGGVKYVYPKELMGEMKAWFASAVAEHLPNAQLLYWT